MFGGEGGEGVLMVQARNGTWSNPAFYGIGGASFGLQAGGEESELILLVMTQKGLDGLLNDHFKIGAQGGLTVATLGSGVEAAISGPTPPDIIVWSSSTGLYGGLTVDGSIVHPNHDDDVPWYGRPITTRDILFGHFDYPRAAGAAAGDRVDRLTNSRLLVAGARAIWRAPAPLGDSLAVELPALTRAALVRIQVPQPMRPDCPSRQMLVQAVAHAEATSQPGKPAAGAPPIRPAGPGTSLDGTAVSVSAQIVNEVPNDPGENRRAIELAPATAALREPGVHENEPRIAAVDQEHRAALSIAVTPYHRCPRTRDVIHLGFTDPIVA